MDTARRGNYESGSDYVLEYGELRFTFNERDFTERVEQAATKLGFVDGTLGDDEREDLVNLAVNGEVPEPQSELGDHINERWGELNGPSERSLVHWIRRLVFRGAWLDQRVMERELAQRSASVSCPVAATIVSVPPSSVARAAPNRRRRTPGGSASRASITTAACPPRSTRRLARSTASSAAWPRRR